MKRKVYAAYRCKMCDHLFTGTEVGVSDEVSLPVIDLATIPERTLHSCSHEMCLFPVGVAELVGVINEQLPQ